MVGYLLGNKLGIALEGHDGMSVKEDDGRVLGTAVDVELGVYDDESLVATSVCPILGAVVDNGAVIKLDPMVGKYEGESLGVKDGDSLGVIEE